MSNEERIDSNPYAYPYFHSDGSGPLLYRLVLEAEESCSPNTSGGGTDNNQQEQSRRSINDIDVKASADLLRRIRSRCIVRPIEASWADSCGDSALHRLCQASRFGRIRVVTQAPTQQQQQQQQQPIPWDDMVTTILKSIVKACPKVASAQNSWRETALHQFASHCGIGSLAGVDEDDTDMSVRDVSYPETADEIVQILLAACPGSAGVKNYLLAPPLHEACSLLHGPDELMRRFVQDLTLNRSAKRIILRNDGLEWMRKRQRLIIRRLIAACPEALFVNDKPGRTPLFRAVESDRSGGDVVAVLIDEIERYCRNNLNLNDSETCNVVKSLAKGEIAATDAVSELARFAEFSFHEGQDLDSHVDRVDEEEVRGAVHCLAKGKINTHVRNRLSPFDFLMAEWQWMPRKLGLAGSTPTGIMAGGAAANTVVSPSRTTVSALVTNALRGGTDPHTITRQLGPLWEKTVLLLRAAYYGSIHDRPGKEKDSRWRLVHASVALSCPSPLVHLMIQMNPDQLTRRDECGRTPLLIACSADVVSHMHAEKKARGMDFGRCVELINLLVRTSNASSRMPDGRARLPLHEAIQAGHQWQSVLQTLFVAEPRALLARDPISGLYPFQLAATVNVNANFSGVRRSNTVELQILTTIFELLRVDPSVCSCSIPGSNF